MKRFTLPPLRYHTLYSEGERTILNQAFPDTEFLFEQDGTGPVILKDSTGKEWMRWVPAISDGATELGNFIERAKAKILIAGYQQVIVENEKNYQAQAELLSVAQSENRDLKKQLKDALWELDVVPDGG